MGVGANLQSQNGRGHCHSGFSTEVCLYLLCSPKDPGPGERVWVKQRCCGCNLGYFKELCLKREPIEFSRYWGRAHLGHMGWSTGTGPHRSPCSLCTLLSAFTPRPQTLALGQGPCLAKLWACSHPVKPFWLWQCEERGREEKLGRHVRSRWKS